ncbi:MAG: hypothetical protein HY348_06410 [Nitrospira defluvii]|nr:hypothetical protein [Nitrospira defluvii]
MPTREHWAMGQASTQQDREVERARSWFYHRYANRPYKTPPPRPPAWINVEYADGQVVVFLDPHHAGRSGR